MSLTEQQQAVVAHDSGSALVFAVAGAGKTTAMVHRIERLVREKQFAPAQILATSFGAANVSDLKKQLHPWPHCQRVDCRTLHSLGRAVIQKAQQFGYYSNFKLNDTPLSPAQQEQKLLNSTLNEARKMQVPFKQELDGLDRQDFLDYVGSCKGNLLYADMSGLSLPQSLQDQVGQAKAPLEALSWYLDLYRIFEIVRQREGIITFDDMLLTGWEILAQYPDVLEAVQKRYQSVLVDEYQDINLAQASILDLITQPHRNYMAIGDDDQTIFEWRGAAPDFILNFSKKYQAVEYRIEDNFRCQAATVALANRVIAFNRNRVAKRLQLTRGFDGTVYESSQPDLDKMSQAIVAQIQQLNDQGISLNDIAVLVRLNAQTPPIEQALISQQIPYRVSKPFYARMEIKTLIEYGRLAWYETRFKGEQRPLSAAQVETLLTAWRNVCNRPKRYITNEVRQHVAAAIRRQEEPVSAILERLCMRLSEGYLVENLQKLAELLRWLAESLSKDACQTLQHLENRLDYQTYLRDSSGFAQTGEGRALSVAAFIDFSRGKGSLLQFMATIRELAAQKIGQNDSSVETAVSLSTIHRAKGLEWEHVFIPQVNQETIPFVINGQGNLEEERRLFYVALTRSKCNVYLYMLKKKRLSVFLKEAASQDTIADIATLTAVLQKPPATWQASETAVVLQMIARHHLQSYFQNWWDADKETQREIAYQVQRLWGAIQTSGQRVSSIREEDVAWWRERYPLPDEGSLSEYPDLDVFLSVRQKEQLVGYVKDRKRITKKKGHPQIIADAPLTEPSVIKPKMWILCDAGWGKIKRIQDMEKRPLASVPRENKMVRLFVTLRPNWDAVPVMIDLSVSQIEFENGASVYTCAKCQLFSSPDQNLVVKEHNQQVHDGLRPSFKKEKKSYIRLNDLRVQTTAP